jgi:hypothetical protein
MPADREGVTHKFHIGDLEGYVTVNLLPQSGLPGEVFLHVNQVGSIERGLAHALAVMISVALRHGVPLAKIAGKLKGMSFEPAGVTSNKAIPMVRSLADYLGRWLEEKYLKPEVSVAPAQSGEELKCPGSASPSGAGGEVRQIGAC